MSARDVPSLFFDEAARFGSFVVRSEARLDVLVADLATGLRVLCERHPDIAEDEIMDRARNQAAALVGNYRIEALPKPTAQSEARDSMMTKHRGRR